MKERLVRRRRCLARVFHLKPLGSVLRRSRKRRRIFIADFSGWRTELQNDSGGYRNRHHKKKRAWRSVTRKRHGASGAWRETSINSRRGRHYKPGMGGGASK